MKRILIAPLDWGLGHATRCIPIIRYLQDKGHEVIIGADGRSLQLLQKEFPAIEFVKMPGYNIVYPKSGSMAVKIARQIPKILLGIRKENTLLKKIIKEKKIDAVISDNRFGLWSKDVPCVFITHQVMVKSPFGERWIHKLNKKYIAKFTECWVPDLPASGLAGDLAHKFPLPGNAKFIGLLSRFVPYPNQQEKGHMLIILSGPEPQRSLFEEILLGQLEETEGTALLIEGITEENERVRLSAKAEIVSHLTSYELRKEIARAEIVVSRPGYSTLMDLAVMGKKAVFIPTPGQTEQEYLAKYLMEKKIAFSMPQDKFDMRTAMEESRKYSGFTASYSGEKFKQAVDLLLAKAQ